MELPRRSPPVVQALVTSRWRTVTRSPGEAERFHATYGRARELVEHPTGHRPRWAYFIVPEQLDAAADRYQVNLARACSRHRRRHLGNAEHPALPLGDCLLERPAGRRAGEVVLGQSKRPAGTHADRRVSSRVQELQGVVRRVLVVDEAEHARDLGSRRDDLGGSLNDHGIRG
ncbi:MAG: hypothetical protein LC799_25315, partial [Actinobacteria bacterium]|nr:hypothetical protein [Actinomycetota bacterium]